MAYPDGVHSGDPQSLMDMELAVKREVGVSTPSSTWMSSQQDQCVQYSTLIGQAPHTVHNHHLTSSPYATTMGNIPSKTDLTVLSPSFLMDSEWTMLQSRQATPTLPTTPDTHHHSPSLHENRTMQLKREPGSLQQSPLIQWVDSRIEYGSCEQGVQAINSESSRDNGQHQFSSSAVHNSHFSQPTTQYSDPTAQLVHQQLSPQEQMHPIAPDGHRPFSLDGFPSINAGDLSAKGLNEGQVISLTVATNNLVLSTPSTSPSIQASSYPPTPSHASSSVPILDTPDPPREDHPVSLKGKRRSRGSKDDDDPSAGAGSPSAIETQETATHKKIANQRSKEKLNKTNTASPIIPLPSRSTFLNYIISPTGPDPYSLSSPPAPYSPSFRPEMSLPVHSPFSRVNPHPTYSHVHPSKAAFPPGPTGHNTYGRSPHTATTGPFFVQQQQQDVSGSIQHPHAQQYLRSHLQHSPRPRQELHKHTYNAHHQDLYTENEHLNSTHPMDPRHQSHVTQQLGSSSVGALSPPTFYPGHRPDMIQMPMEPSDYFGYQPRPSHSNPRGDQMDSPTYPQPPHSTHQQHPHHLQYQLEVQGQSYHMRAYPAHLYNLQSLIPLQQQQQMQQMRQQVPWFQAHNSQTYLDNLGTRSDDDESLSAISFKQVPTRSRVNSTGGIGTRGRSRTLPGRAAMFPESFGPFEPQILQLPSIPRENNGSTSMDLNPQQQVLTPGMIFSSSSSDYGTVGPSTTMSAFVCKDRVSPTLLPPYNTAAPTPYYISKTEPSGSTDNTLEPSATMLMLPAPPKNLCPVCDKTFTRPFNLKSHLLAHENKKPFVCDAVENCGSRFTRRTDWMRHIRAKHPLYDLGQKEGKKEKKKEDEDEGKKGADDTNAENKLKKEEEDDPSIEQETNIKEEEE